MKIYNKTKLLASIVEFILFVAGMVTNFLSGSNDYLFIFLSLLCLIFSVEHAYSAFSKKKAYQDKIEELDERSTLVELKVVHTLAKVITNICILAIVGGIIAYLITKNFYIITLILPLLILVPITFILYLIIYAYYEGKM